MKIFIFSLYLLLFVACSKESDSSLVSGNNNVSEQNENSSPSVIFLVVSADSTNVLLGETATLTAKAYYSDGSVNDVSTICNWTSGDPSKISITENIATAISTGQTIVSAEFENKSGSITLAPFSANILSIGVSQNNASLPLDGSLQLDAYVFYDNGSSKKITNLADWSSQDTNIFTVENTTKKGLISSVTAGNATVDISYNSFTTTANISVSSATISSIQVTPIIGSGSIGLTQQFNATAVLSDGSIQDITNTVAWNSSDSSIAAIDSKGKVSLLKAGTINITANFMSFSKTVDFQVTNKIISSIEVILPTSNLSVGISSQATCIVTYADSSTEDITNSVIWSVDNNLFSSVSNSESTKGYIETFTEGIVNVSASIGAFTNQKSLTISNASLASITISPSETFISSGIDARFQAIGNYDDGTSVDITKNVIWASSNTGLGTISNVFNKKGYFSNLYAGSTTKTLTVSASLAGVTQNASIIIAPGTISSISVNPNSITMNTLKTKKIKAYAHFSDGASVEITNIATWSSSDENLLFVSNSITDAGTISSLQEASVSVTASYKGLSSVTTAVTISDSDAEESNDLGTGLLANYYTGNNFNTLAGQRIDSTINFNWASGQAPLGVGDYFSVRWTGKIKGKLTGNCTLASRSDDGFILTIDGVKEIDVWFPHAPRWDYAYNVAFEEGVKKDITVEFFENGGQAVAELYWQCDGDSSLEVVPTEFLYH